MSQNRGSSLLFLKVPIKRQPTNMGIDPDGKKIYVIHQGANSISIVNKISRTIEKRIGVGETP